MDLEPELATFSDRFGRRVRDAVVELVGQEREDEVTVEELAEHLGVDPEEIYRRWPSKPDLMMHLAYSFLAAVPIPDTGSVRDDVVGFTHGWMEQSGTDLRPVIQTVLGEVHRSVDALRSYELIDTFYLRTLVGMVRRGIERGEVPQDAPVGLAVEMLRCRYSLRYLTRGPIDERFVTGTVDDVLMPILRQDTG